MGKYEHTPFHNPESCPKARWQTVSNRMVEIVPEYKIIRIDVLFQPEAKRDAVRIFVLRVQWQAEVGRCLGRVKGQASVILFSLPIISLYPVLVSRQRGGGLEDGRGRAWGRTEGRQTCIRTFRSVVARSDSMVIGFEELTGTTL